MSVLNTRTLNRTLLARQMLLERTNQCPLAVIEHLVGLQAQAPLPPYVALWSRIENFDPEELSTLMLDRKVVRAALMRSTIHMVSADDALTLRALVQPMIERATKSSHGKGYDGLNMKELGDAARAALREKPLTLTELGKALGERWPKHVPADLAMGARAARLLVQPPPRGLWANSGRATHVDGEVWLKRKIVKKPDAKGTVLRYLRAYGPASIADMQTWSGLTKLKEVVESMRDELRVYKDGDGRELFDALDGALTDELSKAPVRFLGDYDNLTLSHANRSRIVSEATRKMIATRNGQVPGTVLVDGFVQGIWKVERPTKSRATMVIAPFRKLTKPEANEVEREGARLRDWLAPTAQGDLRLTEPPELLP